MTLRVVDLACARGPAQILAGVTFAVAPGEASQFFRGDAAFFGGVSYRYSDQVLLKAEYSSDDYVRETGNGTLDNRSPLNVGISYQYRPGLDLDLA